MNYNLLVIKGMGIFFLSLFSLISFVALTPTVQGCTCDGHECSGGSQTGGGCGLCGILYRTCSGCSWSGWSCVNQGVCSPGSYTCSGSRYYWCNSGCAWQWVGTDSDGDGTDYQCGDSLCDGDYSRVNSNRQCGSGQTQCAGTRYQTCNVCHWVNSGTDSDGDGTDYQCGDSLCDAVPEYVDSTRLTYEYGSCTYGMGHSCATCNDGVDNDCDGSGVDFSDTSSTPIECCTDTFRDCRQFTTTELTKLRDKDVLRKKHHFSRSDLIDWVTSGSTVRACTQSASDTVCCDNPSACVYNGVCYPHMTKQDLDGDGIREICIASSPGEWIEEMELDCTNGIDDDYDGNIDCDDSDCNGAIYGFVTNDDTTIVEGAQIDLYDDSLNLRQTDFTNSSGGYWLEDQCGLSYTIVVQNQNNVAETRSGIGLSETTELQQDFILFSGDVCQSDCTLTSDDIVHASCNGQNNCSFFDAQAAAACDNAQVGWIRNYNESTVIECPSGFPEIKVGLVANVTCGEENLIKKTKAVTYQGKVVNLVVVTCG